MSGTLLPLLSGRDANTTSSTVSAMPDLPRDPAPVVTSAIWSIFTVSTVFLSLRIYCRAFRIRAMWWDDYLLIVGWLFILAANISITKLEEMGFGTSLDFRPRMHTISTLSDDLNKIALGITKTAFAATLLRVATGWQRHLIWFLIISMNCLLGVNAITTWMAACDRVGIDHYEAVLPSCWTVEDSVLVAMVANAYSAIVDFVLALLPWKIIMALKMKKYEKIGVAVAMSVGVLAGIVGVMKIVQITTISGGSDIPYRLSLLFIWGQAEPNATIIASSIPVLRVLFRDISRNYYCTSESRTPSGYLKSDQQSQFPTTTTTTNTNTNNTFSGNAKLADDSGEQNILSQPPKAKSVITRISAIRYNSRSHSDEESGAIEMINQVSPQNPYGPTKGDITRSS